MLGYQNIKIFFSKGYIPNWSEVFVIKKVKNSVPWTYIISDLNQEKLLKRFMKTNCKKQIKKSLEMKKQKREKVINWKVEWNVKWKGYKNPFNIWIHTKDIVQMSEYFSEPKSLGGKVKVEFDLSNYATKVDFKNVTGVSKFAKKVDLAYLKSNIDKVDIDHLKNVPTNLSNLKSR